MAARSTSSAKSKLVTLVASVFAKREFIPTAVFECPVVFRASALCPTAVLPTPLALLRSDRYPSAVFLIPSVLFCRAAYPTAVLSLPLFNSSVHIPTAVFLSPSTLEVSAEYPTAVLKKTTKQKKKGAGVIPCSFSLKNVCSVAQSVAQSL